ncbi:hypothetical protein LMG26685_02875 [Achromobacter mucicolens]|uniref:host specificity protein J n=1 Tax=Achromobacter mucicolens TaxID=1389922 RepID=UPI000B91FC28|nr:host specificity factor TipJ family phage tail protein [Achromobacter mucicolens]OXC91039.1 hypothetical protein BMR85_007530 [Achromobacter sp. KAs 3-5]CAB3653449.1 hypothetical protein LMG26685_02875 [Achromobacter mucicolens]
MEVVDSRPSLVHLPNPISPAGKDVSFAAFLPGETLGAYLARAGVRVADAPMHVWQNGRPVPPQLWKRLIPRTGDQIVIRAKMEGGGGGNKILRTVAMIAVVVASIFAPYLAPAGWGAIGATGALTTTGALISAGVMLAGTLMINAFLPMPLPTAAKLSAGSKYESSPTYSIQGGRNRPRPWEPMMLVMGRHRVVPDSGATPWTNQVGDDQFLNQIFHFGLQGMDLILRNFRIGSTPIDSYDGVQLQRSGPDGLVTMFAGNVDTLQGFALSSNDGWVSRTTPPNVGTITVEIASRLFRVADDGSIDSRRVEFRIQYREVGAPDWLELGFINATYATHYWSARLFPGGQTQVRMGSTNYGDHEEGESWFEIDSATGTIYSGQWWWVPHPFQMGQPWQGIAPDPLVLPGGPGYRLWGNRQEPTRAQISWDVTGGQYEVRVMKVTPDVNDTRESNETAVSQILAYQYDTTDYSEQVRVALRIKATGQLNGAVDELSAIASATCPVWNGVGWVVAETSNPAWWFLWFARGRKGADGKRRFGLGLADSGIDIEGLKAWAAWCDSKNLTFNYVLDRKASAAEVLNLIARAGRAAVSQQTGKLGVIWDAADLPEVATFGPFNIRAGSFQIAYLNEGSVDEIIVNFVNAERNWTMDEVRVAVPGGAANNPLQLDLDGCTNADMAGREANLIAASQVWHRRRVTFESDIEGYVATKGDVVRLTHDLTVWGYSGRMMPGSRGADGSSLPKIVLDSAVPSGGDGIALLRDPAGVMKVVSVTSDVGDVTELTIVTDLTGFSMPGDAPFEDVNSLDWVWQFSPLDMPGRRFKITSVEPSGDGVKFTAIDDDPGYYASEYDPYAYTPPRDGALLGGVIFSLRFTEAIRSVQNDTIDVQLDWSISMSSRVQINYSINGIAQQPITTEARQATVQAKTGDVIVATIRPVNSIGTGQPFTGTYTVQGLLSPLPAVTGLTSVFRDGLTTLVWNPVVDIRQPDYEVRLGSSWSNSRTVGTTRNLEMLAVGNGTYFVAARFQTRGVTIYGPADSIQISGAVLVRNVLVTVQEDPTWTGTLGGGAFVHDGELTLVGVGDILSAPDVLGLEDVLWFGGVEGSGTYTTDASNIVDLGYVAPVRVDFAIDEYALNFGEDFLALPDVLSEVDVLNDSNRQHYRVRPQIQSALDDGVFGEWQDYIPGTINARYFNVRLVLETDQPLIVPFVRHFSWTIDVPDLVQSGTGVTVPSGGLRVNFPKHFHMKPNLQVTTIDAVDGDRAVVLQDVDPEEGFNIQMFNNATPVERVVNWLAQGY